MFYFIINLKLEMEHLTCNKSVSVFSYKKFLAPFSKMNIANPCNSLLLYIY